MTKRGCTRNCYFWSGIWDNPAEHNQEVEWLAVIEVSLKDKTLQENVVITMENVQNQQRKVANWIGPGLDGFQGY